MRRQKSDDRAPGSVEEAIVLLWNTMSIINCARGEPFTLAAYVSRRPRRVDGLLEMVRPRPRHRAVHGA